MHFRLLIFFLFISASIHAQSFSFTLRFGAPLQMPLPLVIKQDGYPDIKIKSARFYSEPLFSPVYWDWRMAYSKNKKEWGLSSIHHKLYLRNKPPEVARFSLSHGYNYVFIDRIVPLTGGVFFAGGGLGLVIAHPESTVRGQVFEEKEVFKGYFPIGPAMMLAFDYRISILRWMYFTAGAKSCFSYSVVPIANGSARLTDVSLHFSAGLGFRKVKREKTDGPFG
ncbi:MAG: hypothetical protein V2A54_15385 [Bacteroidota bacterium]